MKLSGSLLALALLAQAGLVQAQTTEAKKVITLEGAKSVAAAAAAEAKRGNEGASIAIVDDGGNLMYLERIQPTFAMGATISTEKARTAALFGKPTKILEDAIVGGRTPLLNVWSAPLNGGEPIKVGRPDRRRHRRKRGLERRPRRRDRARGRRCPRRPDQREQVGGGAMHSRALLFAAALLALPPVATAQTSDANVTYLPERSGQGRLRQGRADDRGGGLQDSREPARRARNGGGPHPRHRHRLRPPGNGDARDRRHGGRTEDDRPRGVSRHRHSGRRDARARASGDVVVIPNGIPHWFKEGEARRSSITW